MNEYKYEDMACIHNTYSMKSVACSGKCYILLQLHYEEPIDTITFIDLRSKMVCILDIK